MRPITCLRFHHPQLPPSKVSVEAGESHQGNETRHDIWVQNDRQRDWLPHISKGTDHSVQNTFQIFHQYNNSLLIVLRQTPIKRRLVVISNAIGDNLIRTTISQRRKTARLLIKREIFSVDRLLTKTIMRKVIFTETSGRSRTLKKRKIVNERSRFPFLGPNGNFEIEKNPLWTVQCPGLFTLERYIQVENRGECNLSLCSYIVHSFHL